MSTMPWILADPLTNAQRWLQDQDVALYATPSVGRTTVSADPIRIIGMGLESSGRSSVSATLSVHTTVSAGSAGKTLVRGEIGHLYEQAGAIQGTSTVSGWLLHGHVRDFAGASWSATKVSGDLSVRRWSKISGAQESDNWGSGENLPPMGGGRDDGPTRRRFVPRSTGLTSERETWRR